MRLDFIACKYTHFIQYGKTIEYFFAKRIRKLQKKQEVPETNEALLFFWSSVFH